MEPVPDAAVSRRGCAGDFTRRCLRTADVALKRDEAMHVAPMWHRCRSGFAHTAAVRKVCLWLRRRFCSLILLIHLSARWSAALPPPVPSRQRAVPAASLSCSLVPLRYASACAPVRIRLYQSTTALCRRCCGWQSAAEPERPKRGRAAAAPAAVIPGSIHYTSMPLQHPGGPRCFPRLPVCPVSRVAGAGATLRRVGSSAASEAFAPPLRWLALARARCMDKRANS